MSALKTGMVGGAKHGGCNAGELWTQNNETKDLDDESVQHSDAIFSVLAITVYMLVGAVYFIPRFGWSGWEVMYFAFNIQAYRMSSLPRTYGHRPEVVM